jgi:hypothetical protein
MKTNIPGDYMARANNAGAVIFNAIKKRAIALDYPALTEIVKQRYYYTDFTQAHSMPDLNGQIQMGKVVAVDFDKRDNMVKSVAELLRHRIIKDATLQFLCESYQALGEIKSKVTMKGWLRLISIRVNFNKQVQGVNCSF